MNTHVWQRLKLVALRVNLSVVGVVRARLVRVVDLVRAGMVSRITHQRFLLFKGGSNSTATDSQRHKQ